jgi:hypothetical protein
MVNIYIIIRPTPVFDGGKHSFLVCKDYVDNKSIHESYIRNVFRLSISCTARSFLIRCLVPHAQSTGTRCYANQTHSKHRRRRTQPSHLRECSRERVIGPPYETYFSTVVR